MAKQIKHVSTIMALLAALIWTMPTQALFAADAGSSQSVQKQGAGSGLSNAISDFQSRLPSIFHEQAAADVGNKPRLRTHVYTSTGFTSDGNLGEKQSDAAWVARVSPGLTLEMPIGDRLYTQLDYTYSFATIQGKQTNANTNSHSLSALARYALTEATQLGLKENIQWSELPGAAAGNMFALNSTTADVTHKFSDILDGYLSDTLQWFQDETETDEGSFNQQFIDNGIAGGVNYEITDRVTLTPSAGWNVRDFSAVNTKDYWQVRYKMAGSYKLGPQTTLNSHIGHNIRKFSEGSDQTDNSLLWGAGIVNNVTKKLAWNFDYNHDTTDTFDTGFLNRTNTQATNADNLDRNFRVVRSDRFLLATSYVINERNRVGLFGDLQFINADAEDNIATGVSGDEITMEFGPSYAFKVNEYMDFTLSYVFGRRSLSEDAVSGRTNYTFNRVDAGLNFAI